MKRNSYISDSVKSRLPRYYRFLGLLQNKNINRISSKELAEIMGLTASQIRQDFNCFGGFGQQGYGYNVPQLKTEIGNIIGIQSEYNTVLIGVGNLGKAIATHFDFSKKGFNLCAVFDSDKTLVGKQIGKLNIMDYDTIADYCKENKPIVAVLCIPENAAKKVTEDLIQYGVKYFWNFSHYDINSDFPDIICENVHLNDSLMKLCYNITTAEEKE